MTRQEATQKIRAIVGERGDVQANRNWCFVHPNHPSRIITIAHDLLKAGFETTQVGRDLSSISIELP